MLLSSISFLSLLHNKHIQLDRISKRPICSFMTGFSLVHLKWKPNDDSLCLLEASKYHCTDITIWTEAGWPMLQITKGEVVGRFNIIIKKNTSFVYVAIIVIEFTLAEVPTWLEGRHFQAYLELMRWTIILFKNQTELESFVSDFDVC